MSVGERRGVKQSELVSKRDEEGESRVMETAGGRGRDNAGKIGAEAVKSRAVWKTRGAKSFESVDSLQLPH